MRSSLRSLGLAAVVASMAAALDIPLIKPEGWRQKPINTGRRAEKDAAALAKAQAKRDRREARNLKTKEPS